jgi:hypothetical protein|tara:strand:- start:23 stop:442 length:420 start_codon:yes stop_codon:yes gene_type:complete
MNLVDAGGNIENFGVNLKLNSIEAEEFYCEAMRLWFEDNKGYHTLSLTSHEFMLNDGFNDISVIYIEDSILRMKALSEDPYETLISMLEFIAEHHNKTIEVYNYLEENEQEVLSGAISNAIEEEGEEEIESEEDSDGWI